jgi:uncharacterized RDD family membrane protein YckC
MRPLDDFDLRAENEELPLAAIWKRVFAWILDNVLLAVGLFLWLGLLLTGGTGVNYFFSVLLFVFFPSILLVPTLYFSFFESSKYKATPGAMLLKIQVVDMQYQKLDFGKAFVRTIFRWFSTGLLLLGYVVGLFTPKRQTLHDLIAQTLVIDKKSAPKNEY